MFFYNIKLQQALLEYVRITLPLIRYLCNSCVKLVLFRGTAATGSGKTLAFIIPAVERLRKKGFKKEQGVSWWLLEARLVACSMSSWLKDTIISCEVFKLPTDY